MPTMNAKSRWLISHLLLVSIFWTTGCPSWAQGLDVLCQQHQQLIAKAYDERVPIETVMKLASGNDLVFVGESHYEEMPITMYRQMLDQLVDNDPRFNCLFIEDGASSSGASQLERCNVDSSLLNRNKITSDTSAACEDGSTSWTAVENEAYKLNLKVFAIDEYQACQNLKENSAALDNCRDEKMQSNIQKRIDARLCDKALVINGFPHLTSIFPGHLPLAQRRFHDADNKSYSNFRISFMFSTYSKTDKTFDPRWRWADWQLTTQDRRPQEYLCPDDDQPPSPSETFSFINFSLGVNQHPYVWINNQPFGNWLDFDATIIVGAQSSPASLRLKTQPQTTFKQE